LPVVVASNWMISVGFRSGANEPILGRSWIFVHPPAPAPLPPPGPLPPAALPSPPLPPAEDVPALPVVPPAPSFGADELLLQAAANRVAATPKVPR
jgi:hypothetical protein